LQYYETLSTWDSEWWFIKEEIRGRAESSTITGCGIPPLGPQVTQAKEEDDRSMDYDSYPVRLQTVAHILAQYDRVSQKEWQRVQAQPEYVRRHPGAVEWARPGPRLLGPDKDDQKGQLCWRVAAPGDDHPAHMGRIVAWEWPSGETLVEFHLDGFPDADEFYGLKRAVEEEVNDRAYWMVEKMTRSALEIQVEATFEDLDGCLRKFHLARAEKGWCWGTNPMTGQAVFTRLALCPGGLVCRGAQIWCVEALDILSRAGLPVQFCTIGAAPLPAPYDEESDGLSVMFWPDWNQEKTSPSYREYIGKLMDEFEERGIIQDRPLWLTQPERMEVPETASTTMAEPAAQVAQTEAVTVNESASTARALPPVERETTRNIAAVPPAIDAPQTDWFGYYDRVTGGRREKPEPPAKDAPTDVWFHWFHYVRDVQKRRTTLKELAQDIGLSYGRVRELHRGYRSQFHTDEGTETIQE